MKDNKVRKIKHSLKETTNTFHDHLSFNTFYQSGERLRRSESDSIKEVTPLRRSNDKFNKKENRILFYILYFTCF